MNFQEEIDNAIKGRWLYFVGDRLPPDWYAGFKEWEKLAEEGDSKAQVNVGRCYAEGRGIDKSKEQAYIWMSKAAAQNDPRAYRDLYYLFSSKDSDEKDLRLAEEFLSKAVALGEQNALSVMQTRQAVKAKQEKEQGESLKRTSSAALAKEVQEAIDLNDLAKAKKLLTGPAAEDIPWASQLLPYLDITTSYTKENKTEKTYLSAGIYQGTSQTVVTNHKMWRALVSFHNPTTLTLELRFHKNKLAPKTTTINVIDYNDSGLSKEYFSFSPKISFAPEFNILYTTTIVLPPVLSSKDNCFVLTACFGDQEHPVVQDFRRFRDDYLMKHSTGQLMISLYYRIGPTLAAFVGRYPMLMALLRGCFGFVQRILPRRLDS